MALLFENELPTRASALSKSRRAGGISQSAILAIKKAGAIARKSGTNARISPENCVGAQKKAAWGAKMYTASKLTKMRRMDRLIQHTKNTGRRSSRQGVQRSLALF
jgi:hypothetical protein